MTNQKPQCPKCPGEMVQGFVPDFSQGSAFIGEWHAGQPKKSFWTRTKVGPGAGIPIGVFRCQRCGFLEFYAASQFLAQ